MDDDEGFLDDGESGAERISREADHGPGEIPGTGCASSGSNGGAGGSRGLATTKRLGQNREGQVADASTTPSGGAVDGK